ncbi:MAG TPA: protein-methionine-sulfoxide reductase catalytic subunit MsrP [Candidatus Acidoferrales bacterium]
MLIRIPKGWEIPEREAAAEDVYFSRRRFLRTTALGLGGIAAGCSMSTVNGMQVPGLSGLAALNATRNEKYVVPGRNVTPIEVTAGYNNFYEFTTDKERVAYLAARFKTRPWQVDVRGLVEKPFQFDVDELIKRFPLEERVYRLRCVEAWSIVVPWIGIPLAKFIEWAKPTSRARFLRMLTFYKPGEAVGQREQDWYPWPYYEGLRLDEASNELAMIVVGCYGRVMPNQNGSPLRLIVPWKYGYKSIKSIVRFEFTDRQPPTFWNKIAPKEYDFLSNVNPAVPHPRWSQATEEDVATGKRIPTLPYNGYGEFVAHLYK